MRFLIVLSFLSACSHYQPVYPYGNGTSFSTAKVPLSKKTKEKNLKESLAKIEEIQKRIDYLSKKIGNRTYNIDYRIKKYETYIQRYEKKIGRGQPVKNEDRLIYYYEVINDLESQEQVSLDDLYNKIDVYKARLKKEIIRLELVKPSE